MVIAELDITNCDFQFSICRDQRIFCHLGDQLGMTTLQSFAGSLTLATPSKEATKKLSQKIK